MIITTLLFLLVLAILIFVHELGHFLAAKKSGIRVDEFAIGFPPKIFSFTKGETKYSLNLIPFGGFVKIFGENPDPSDKELIRAGDSSTGDNKRSFAFAPKWKQISVLGAGIFFNIIFAWLLISISFMFGSLVPISDESSEYSKYIKDSQVILTGVMEETPASLAGLEKGDQILHLSLANNADNIAIENITVTDIRRIIEDSAGQELELTYKRNGNIATTTINPELDETENRQVIGIYMENVGIVKLNPFLALWEGGKMTVKTFNQVVVGLGTFLFQAIRGQGDFSQVSGPVGIVSLVGDAAGFGLAYFLGFLAFISLNLAVINLIPFPALDGGRILFVIIEAIIRRPIKAQIVNTLNLLGFVLLIGLMLVITYRDILKLF
jgi:regulator of sigma E protease